MKLRYLITLLLAVFMGLEVNAQTNENLTFKGNARFSYMSSGPNADDIFEGTAFLRVRVGASYSFNENSSFHARLATTQSDELPAVRFTIIPDGGGIDAGTVSFDHFYYRYSNDGLDLKVGRFQHTPGVKSNSGRSILRFQSNNINNHWIDGFHLKKYLNDEWFGEVVGEYQNRGNTSYSYRPLLNFGKNEHNAAAYIGLQNLTRDDNNFIQKNIAVFVAPGAYLKPDGYSTYFAALAQLTHDTPVESFRGGSFRIAAEAGQNLNAAEFGEGNILNLSFGVHNFADKHQLMIEFTKTGTEWQTANVYAPNADEMEIRYRYFITDNFNIDFRYRIRDSRSDFVDTNYNFFARATIFF